MASPAAWREALVELAGLKLRLNRAGRGQPLLVLHHDIGSLDRLDFTVVGPVVNMVSRLEGSPRRAAKLRSAPRPSPPPCRPHLPVP